MMLVKPIYIDVCALSRPFDEQGYLRIRLETEAVNLILSKVKDGNHRLLVSPVHDIEIEAIADTFERTELKIALDSIGERIKLDKAKTRARSEDLINLGFGVADAVHVAFAEQAGASFISCDDRLIKKCLAGNIRVWCGNPVAFCEKEELR
jgi:predicted nucleic acid-binding protein